MKVLGKGNKERYTILPDIVTKFLRMYCKEQQITNKQGFLFVSRDKESHINSKSIINVNDTIRMYKKGKIIMYKIVHDISP